MSAGSSPPQIRLPYQPPSRPPIPAGAAPRTLAFTALVLAIMPFPLGWVPAFTLAVVVLVLTHTGLEGGRGMAAAALVISSLWITAAVGAGLVFAVVGSDSGGIGSARAVGSGDVDVYDIREGDCIAEIPPQEVIDTLPVVPCGEPHGAEIYAVFDVAGDESTKQADIDRFAQGGCTRRFADFVGSRYDQSRLRIESISPVEGELEDDRSVVCMVEDPGRSTTGSLRGSGR